MPSASPSSSCASLPTYRKGIEAAARPPAVERIYRRDIRFLIESVCLLCGKCWFHFYFIKNKIAQEQSTNTRFFAFSLCPLPSFLSRTNQHPGQFSHLLLTMTFPKLPPALLLDCARVFYRINCCCAAFYVFLSA